MSMHAGLEVIPRVFLQAPKVTDGEKREWGSLSKSRGLLRAFSVAASTATEELNPSSPGGACDQHLKESGLGGRGL